MPNYTTILQRPLDSLSWEDDNFIEELIGVAQLFRPFSVAITEFIACHGYNGDTADTEAKIAYIRKTFSGADMQAPREVREWFTASQPIKRDTAFQICFAFGLDGSETDEFFTRYYARERSFNCHRIQEAIYYFCLNNGLPYSEAVDIQARIPPVSEGKQSDCVVYTGSIIAELNSLETKDELIAYLTDNIDKFSFSNVTAYETIRRLWNRAAGPDGLLIKEREKLPSLLDDAVFGKKVVLHTKSPDIKSWDAYLAIFQLDKKSVGKLGTDRTIRPLIDKLHVGVRDSFPDRQGIDLIMHGKPISYERVRKWLVLLAFYTFWAKKALDIGSYAAQPEDVRRFHSKIKHILIDAGYPELYIGNPYDWIFCFSVKSDEPLTTFRYIWNELLAAALEEHQ